MSEMPYLKNAKEERMGKKRKGNAPQRTIDDWLHDLLNGGEDAFCCLTKAERALLFLATKNGQMILRGLDELARLAALGYQPHPDVMEELEKRFNSPRAWLIPPTNAPLPEVD